MNIYVKRTIDLDSEELTGLSELFEYVFGKPRSAVAIKNEYCCNSKGYSFHAFCITENVSVVGHVAYVPFIYTINEKESFYAALGVDAMIHPDYQGHGLYKQLSIACMDLAMKDGCIMRIGFPNENSFPIQIKAFKFNEIGFLDTYILPIDISGIKPSLKFLNFASRSLAWLLSWISTLSCFSSKEHTFKIHKDRQSFDKHRYRWFGGNYNIIQKNDFQFVYKNSEFKGIKASFLMDVFPLSKNSFDSSVREIRHREKHTPAIIYVGKLPFIPLSMIRIPHRWEPKHFHFVGKIIDETSSLDSSVYDIKNWELNLSNFDLL